VDIQFITGSSTCLVKIYYEDSLTENFQTKEIESIKFEKDANKLQVLNIYIKGVANSFLLKNLDSINFFIAATPVPNIANINPTSGYIGDDVLITGTNFGATQDTSIVSFKGKNAIDYTSWSDTQIKIKVPAGASTGKLSATVHGIKSNELDFTVLAKLLSLTPNSGKIGDTITISGSGFGSSRGSSFVTFNDTIATEYISWSDVQIKVKVPKGAKTGKVVQMANSIKSNGLDFTVLVYPNLESITPSTAKIGDTVVLAGTNFGIGKDTSFVYFAGKKAANYISRSATQIKLKVPVGTKTGKVYITSGANKTNELDFSIIPQITSIMPDSAGITEQITIYGTNFGDKAGTSTVAFNDTITTDFISWSDIQIELKVPAGAVSGKVRVNVTGLPSNDVNFTVIQHIASINPYILKIGDPITITGTNFGATRGTNKVLLNTIEAPSYDSWSDTEIKIKIPDNAFSGKLYVVKGSRKSNAADFFIIPEIAAINPATGRLNDIVTISGKGFGTVQGASTVDFNGGPATEIQGWSNGSISVKVPGTAKTGKVSVTVSGQKSNEVDFSILPSISSIFPTSGLVGDQITISGACFGASQGTSFVSFQGANASSYISWADNQIVAVVPTGTQNGKLSVTVGGVKSNELDFYLKPQISSISPNNAYLGTQITISGVNFGASQGTSIVAFTGGNASSIQSWSNTSIVVIAPNSATSGPVSVTVNNIKSNELDFTPLSVMIGQQEWMIKNLDVSTYKNGETIPQCTDETEWDNLTTGAWCYYSNSSDNGVIYGKLYNWYAVNDSRGLAPSGWHIPTNNEWSSLSTYLGGNSVSGGKLKETGTSHWSAPNTNATNESGFTALGAGYRYLQYAHLGDVGAFWTSTQADAQTAYEWQILYNAGTISNNPQGKALGFSVRCLKD